MTEYLDTRRTLLEERERVRVSWPKTKFIYFAYERNKQGIREPSL